MTNQPGKTPEDLDALLDHALDRALASYTTSSPPLGLEERLQVRLAAAANLPRRRPLVALHWPWVGAAALATAAAILLLLRLHVPPAPPTVGSIQHNPPPAETLPAAPHSAATRQLVRRTKFSGNAASHVNPPGPTQRELIAQLLANAPEVIVSLAKADEDLDKPIEIKPIPADPLVIEPIQITSIDNPAEPGGSL